MYYHSISAKIQILQKEEGIALHASGHGLQEVFFSPTELKVMQNSFINHTL